MFCLFFFFQAEDGIRDLTVTGVQTCALPICREIGQRRGNGVDQRRRIEERSHLLAAEDDHGTSSSLPVVLREASSSCPFAASASGSTCSIFTLRSPRSTAPSTAAARLRSSSRVST